MNRLKAGASALALIVAGCASGPASRIYLLTPPGQVAAVDAPDPEQPRVQLRPVLVPDYLDTTDLLLRSGPYEVKASPSARWGERMSKGLTDALTAALTARLSQNLITLDQDDGRSSRQILVDVSAFDLWPDGHCVLTASWTILERYTHNPMCGGREVFEVQAMGQGAVDDTALVAAMARAVGELADRIAKDVRRPAITTLYPRIERKNRPFARIGTMVRINYSLPGESLKTPPSAGAEVTAINDLPSIRLR
jgi:uncharacterized lipoprotein YmbA